MGRHSPEPSQTAYPWRTAARTAIQALVGLCAILPFIVGASGLEQTGLVGTALVVSAGVTRVMATKQFNDWLLRFIPWLAAEPDQ